MSHAPITPTNPPPPSIFSPTRWIGNITFTDATGQPQTRGVYVVVRNQNGDEVRDQVAQVAANVKQACTRIFEELCNNVSETVRGRGNQGIAKFDNMNDEGMEASVVLKSGTIRTGRIPMDNTVPRMQETWNNFKETLLGALPPRPTPPAPPPPVPPLLSPNNVQVFLGAPQGPSLRRPVVESTLFDDEDSAVSDSEESVASDETAGDIDSTTDDENDVEEMGRPNNLRRQPLRNFSEEDDEIGLLSLNGHQGENDKRASSSSVRHRTATRPVIASHLRRSNESNLPNHSLSREQSLAARRNHPAHRSNYQPLLNQWSNN